ncbi:MAG: hypothetical protein U0931_03145 [Vulcanimicrobiota bacterium]
MDELEEYLQAQAGEGALESSGQFTLDRQRALTKLAHFQLPGEHYWALKVVQAAVAGAASALRIDLGSTGSHFYWESPFGLDELENAFYDPEPSGSSALDHLRVALWSVGYANMRPFQYRPAGSRQSLVWTGDKFTRVACKPSQHAILTVSLRTRQEQQQGWFLLQGIEAVSRNADLARLLREQAYVCPVPLTLNGQRIDSIQSCPCHGPDFSRVPIGLIWGQPGEHRLGLPQNSDRAPSLEVSSPNLPLYLINPEARDAGCFGLVAGSLDRQLNRSRLIWVRDGVVVSIELLALEGSVSCAVFASANQLPADLTGFSVGAGPLRDERVRMVLEALGPSVRGLRLDISHQVASERSSLRGVGVVAIGFGSLFLAMGSVLGSVVPFVPGVAAAALGVRLFTLKGGMQESGRQLALALSDFQSGWPQVLLGRAEPARPVAARPSVQAHPSAGLASQVETVRDRQPKWRKSQRPPGN